MCFFSFFFCFCYFRLFCDFIFLLSSCCRYFVLTLLCSIHFELFTIVCVVFVWLIHFSHTQFQKNFVVIKLVRNFQKGQSAFQVNAHTLSRFISVFLSRLIISFCRSNELIFVLHILYIYINNRVCVCALNWYCFLSKSIYSFLHSCSYFCLLSIFVYKCRSDDPRSDIPERRSSLRNIDCVRCERDYKEYST